MKSGKLFMLLLSTAFLASCKMSCNMGGTTEKPIKENTVTSATSDGSLTGAIIKNDIELEAHDVKVKEAYLMDENNNPLTKNEARIGEKIYMVLKLDSGWRKTEGKSFVGAGERIMTSGGNVIVDAEDIFKTYEATGFPADKAEVINLTAVITNANPGVTDFVTTFKVWDKKGPGEVKGKYRFKIIP